MNNSRKCLAYLVLLLLMFNASPVFADDQPEPGKWQWYGELFGWGAEMKGTARTGEDIDVPLGDILDNLDFGFMGTLAARKDKWTLFADFIYVNLGEKATVPLAIPALVEAKLNLDLRKYISTFGAAYQVADTGRTTINLLAGGRYLSIDADLKYDIDTVASGRVSESGSNLDFIVGVRGKTDLNEKWYINYYGDIGTGNSDLTWQAVAGINYRFSKVDLTLGYAYMDWDFDKKSEIKDMALKGPYAGIKFRF